MSHSRRRLVAGLLALSAVALAVGGLVALRSAPAQAASAPAAAPAMPVSIAEVVQREIAPWSEHSGRLEAVDRVEIRARVAGTLLAVHFREGALVRAGDRLLTIDPAPYAAEVQRLQAQVAAAQTRLTHARAEGQRAQRLWDERAIAQRELDERLNAAREAQAQLQAAEAALDGARLNLGYTELRAPVSGRMGRLEVTPGNFVAAGGASPVLATLVSVHPIYASFEADEARIGQVLADLGGAVRARIERVPVQAQVGERQLQGRLQLVDNQVDASSGTVRVRAVFDNLDGALLPGQFARLRLGQPSARPALLVNERAIGTDQDKRFVMVVGADGTASYRQVTLGVAVDGLRAVTSGLKAGERIVVNGVQRVRPGAPLAPTLVPMETRGDLRAGAGAAAAKS